MNSSASASLDSDDSVSGRPGPLSEDALAMLVAGGILGIVLAVLLVAGETVEDTLLNPLAGWLAKPGEWDVNPLAGLQQWGGILVAAVVCGGVGLLAGRLRGYRLAPFAGGLVVILGLATLAYLMAGQAVIKHASLSYALWALLVGLVISNTIGAGGWLRSAAMTELYIKVGLVLYGAEILFSRLWAFGLPGVCVAWVVTPIVLITTYWFGQRILKIESPTLNMVISADMSVCGVSAAIATSAACRAKKEELSLAISLSLAFTVVMMFVLPLVISAMGLSAIVGGAWMGGTIDATGAVAAAGEMLDPNAAAVAITIKMIQNILIGVVAFGVAVYWTRFMETGSDGGAGPQVGISEIWRRFPRFILGFAAASLLFSLLAWSGPPGEALATTASGFTKNLRGWFFCLAFVSIGLESNFANLAKCLKGGKPIVLYIVGQSLNLCLTLAMAWLVFHWLFPELVTTIEQASP